MADGWDQDSTCDFSQVTTEDNDQAQDSSHVYQDGISGRNRLAALVENLSARERVNRLVDVMCEEEGIPRSPSGGFRAQAPAGPTALAAADMEASQGPQEPQDDGMPDYTADELAALEGLQMSQEPAPAPAPAVMNIMGEVPEKILNKDGKCHFKGKMWHLTFKGHLDFQELRNWVQDNWGNIKTYSLVWELGDSEATYPHTHFMFVLEKELQFKSAKNWDFKDIHPHVKQIRGQQQLENVWKYHQKSPVKIEQVGLDKADPYKECVTACKDGKRSWTSLLLDEGLGKQLKGGMTYYKEVHAAARAKTSIELKPGKTHQWQVEFRDWIDMLGPKLQDVKVKIGTTTALRSEFLSRVIFNFWGAGNKGKSYMGKYAMANWNWMLATPANNSDLSYRWVNKAVKDAPGYDGLWLDCARSVQDSDPKFLEACKFCEDVKGGSVTAGKYEGGAAIAADGWPVVITTNWPIPNDEQRFSSDRIENTVFEVLADGTCPSFTKFVNEFSKNIV